MSLCSSNTIPYTTVVPYFTLLKLSDQVVVVRVLSGLFFHWQSVQPNNITPQYLTMKYKLNKTHMNKQMNK